MTEIIFSLPLNISVVDSTGQDISHLIQHCYHGRILEAPLHQAESSLSELQKRSFSRELEIGRCWRDREGHLATNLLASHCDRGEQGSNSARAWYMVCSSRRGRSFLSRGEVWRVSGTCDPTEICVEGPDYRHPAARCVSHEFYQSLARGPREQMVETDAEVQYSRPYAYEVVLTTEDSNEIVVAQHMEVQPVDHDEQPIGPPSTCDNCVQVGVDDVPRNTFRMVMNVVFWVSWTICTIHSVQWAMAGFPILEVGSSLNTTMITNATADFRL